MTLHLFTRRGFLFLPSSVIGWAVFLGMLAFLIWTFLDIDSRSHSVSDTLINFVFSALLVAVVYSIIGFIGSPRK